MIHSWAERGPRRFRSTSTRLRETVSVSRDREIDRPSGVRGGEWFSGTVSRVGVGLLSAACSVRLL